MTLKRKAALAGLLLALAVAAAGCGGAGGQEPKAKRGVAEAAAGFTETAQAQDMKITLAIEPLKVGENRFVVNLSDKSVTAVEAQVVMATMGHGLVVDLNQTAPGRFEASSPVIDMDGRWMVRIKATLASGAENDATFHFVIKPQ